MKTQLSTIKFSKEKFIQPGIMLDHIINKPCGGFWTSSQKENGKSDWIEFCEREYESGLTGSVYEYQVDQKSRILFSSDDVSRFVINHPRLPNYKILDWDKIAQEYDGFSYDFGGNYDLFYGWDVESSVWFNCDIIKGN